MHWEALMTGGYDELHETYLFSLNVIPTIYAFYVIKCVFDNMKTPTIIANIFSFLGENSFGIYLFSIYSQVRLIGPVYNRIIDIMPRLPLLACLLYVFVVLIIEAIGVSILRKIPGVKKLI